MHKLFLILSVSLLILTTHTYSQKPVLISIQESDVSTLSGWPLNRKWYAIAVENIISSGAERVFIDLAFPYGDAAHPESDEFFFRVLKKHKNVFLLTNKDVSIKDSIRILKRYMLHSERFFNSFSASFRIKKDMLFLESDNQNSLLERLLPAEQIPKSALIDFPDSTLNADYSFLTAIKNSINCEGTDVIVSLDYAGATSYILNPNTESLVTPTQLQIQAARKLRMNQYAKLWPNWLLALVVSGSLLPLLFIKFKLNKKTAGISSLALGSFIFAILNLSHIFIFDAWYAIFVIPLSFIGYDLMKKTYYYRYQEMPQHLTSVPDQRNSQELEELRNKVQYYENLYPQTAPSELDDFYERAGILCHRESPLIPILRKSRKIAQSDIPLMILGESGTGKEMLAYFIHTSSNRSSKPFIAVNCASLNENLIESELFGHEAGAFTGAAKRKLGRFELADGGTLFLDEIGETSVSTQVKLLRVLQEGVFERVGAVQPIKVSVRIITATHRDLQKQIEEGYFREDLYFRLNGFSLFIPPLRERTMDIEFLFRNFLYKQDQDLKVSQSIIDWLKVQQWNGNVRELQAATQRAVLNARLHNRLFLVPEDFELANSISTVNKENHRLSAEILNCLRKHQFKHRSISLTADELSLHRVTVTEYLRGWIIRYLLTFGNQPKKISNVLSKGASVDNPDKFQERIDNYINNIIEKISAGIKAEATDHEIILNNFKNIPGEFQEDLFQLIQKVRKDRV